MPNYRPPTTESLRFGVFEIDPSAGELRKHGVRIKLQDQPFAVLLILLEKPGQLVTKEELQQRLWPVDTFVEFDKGIYNAMKRLRETLGDEAETPRYIETLPRRGYRFIAPVETHIQELAVPEVSPAPETPKPAAATKRGVLLALSLALVAGASVMIWVKLPLSQAVPKVVDSVQITKDGSIKAVATFRLVSDSNSLYFQEGQLSESEQNVALVQVSTQGGETARIPISLRNPIALDFSQVRSELLLSAGEFDVPSNERPLWALPLPAGPPHRLGDLVAHDACWAPDGHHLIFSRGADVIAADSDGSNVRKLVSVEGVFPYWLRFSPDGKRVRFTVLKFGGRPEETEIMEMAPDGSGLHRLPMHGGCCGTWSPDGRYYFFRKIRDTWVLPERHSILGEIELGTPVQLTAGPIMYGAPTPSADGKGLFVVGEQHRGELAQYTSTSKKWVPFLGGISAGELEVSPDGQWVIYSTFPDSNLWRSKLDGSERLQLTFAPVNAHEPRWSPDGKQVLFTDFPHRICVVPSDGGAVRQLMPSDRPESIGAGAWLPDGNSIIFGRHLGCPPGDNSCWSIFRLDLKTQQVSQIPGSQNMVGARLSRDGHYLSAVLINRNTIMLYDLKTKTWSKIAKAYGSVAWSHDSRSIYVHLKHEKEPDELARISVPDGKVEHIVSLKGITLGGFWHDWISLLADDSPLFTVDRSTEEIYRLKLEYY
jgi:DNA-binding winged helix-turn-helix (wHTH) protein/Tol biopolymer transport system component